MNTSPLVSIVLPFLDAERFLEETVQSVFAQTFPDWELWLVDDGSSDGSTAIARAHEARDARVHYLDHPGHENRGISASRNLGIAHARGRYLALLDADDVYLPDKLERQIAMLEEHPRAAMVYGRSLYWSGWTGDPADRARDWVQDHWIRGDVVLPPPRPVALHLTGRAAVPCPCSVLAHTDAVRAVGGFEDRFRGMFEDQAFYAKFCLQHAVYVSNACLDRYRLHPESICAVTERAGALQEARRRFLAWLVEHLRATGTTDPATWDAVRQEAWLLRRHEGETAAAQQRRRQLDKWRVRLEATLLPRVLRSALWRHRVPELADPSAPRFGRGN
jgi:glycosyltransferase involved in cell wall biosynthesis